MVMMMNKRFLINVHFSHVGGIKEHQNQIIECKAV